jgi:hypothetical protein
MVMVLKKEGNWCIYLNFCALNKLAIKDKAPISFIDDLLNELHDAKFSLNWTFAQDTTKS